MPQSRRRGPDLVTVGGVVAHLPLVCPAQCAAEQLRYVVRHQRTGRLSRLPLALVLLTDPASTRALACIRLLHSRLKELLAAGGRHRSGYARHAAPGRAPRARWPPGPRLMPVPNSFHRALLGTAPRLHHSGHPHRTAARPDRHATAVAHLSRSLPRTIKTLLGTSRMVAEAVWLTVAPLIAAAVISAWWANPLAPLLPSHVSCCTAPSSPPDSSSWPRHSTPRSFDSQPHRRGSTPHPRPPRRADRHQLRPTIHPPRRPLTDGPPSHRTTPDHLQQE